MTSYFKYTNGEAFTLNNVDYRGFFNIVDEKAYTGKNKTDLSEELSPKETYISNFYLEKMEFDNQYESIDDITPTYSNVFDVLNKTQLDSIFNKINKNNLIVFKSLTVNNPKIINFDENNSHYYSLSSSPLDEGGADTMFGKKYVSHSEHFSNFPEWEFLDRIKLGEFFIKSDQTFKYLCSTGTDLIIIKGSFEDENYIEYTIEDLEIPQEVYQIHYNENENKITIIINDEMKIYDAINFIECDKFILIDSIKLYDVESIILKWSLERKFSDTFGKFNKRFYNVNPNPTEFMKFGNNYRISLMNDMLYFWNKYDMNVIFNMEITKYNISNILSLDIRDVDDYVGILHKDESNFKVTFFDPLDVDNTIKTQIISEFDESDNYRMSFSKFDSNLWFLNSTTQGQTRLISNSSYPIGRFRDYNLKYFQKMAFGTTYQKFGDSIIKWNTNTSKANFYNNLMFMSSSKSNKNYIFLHNDGRLYPLAQDIKKYYEHSIDLNTVKYFNGMRCGDVSFGLFFNKNISSILKDILNLYTKATNSFMLNKSDVFLKKIDEISYEVDNLYMNGNESVNIVTTQRIFNLLTNLQKSLIANLIS